MTIPNTKLCSAAGIMSAGGICSETQTEKTYDLTLEQWIDFLEDQPERPDPAHPGETLPAHAAAICQSAQDWDANMTALEVACRRLGKYCGYELRVAIKRMKAAR